jgi:hypothetical protein
VQNNALMKTTIERVNQRQAGIENEFLSMEVSQKKEMRTKRHWAEILQQCKFKNGTQTMAN